MSVFYALRITQEYRFRNSESLPDIVTRVRNGKSTTRFIRAHQLKEVKSQLAQYKRFRKLMDEWLQLAIEHAEERLQITRNIELQADCARVFFALRITGTHAFSVIAYCLPLLNWGILPLLCLHK